MTPEERVGQLHALLAVLARRAPIAITAAELTSLNGTITVETTQQGSVVVTFVQQQSLVQVPRIVPSGRPG